MIQHHTIQNLRRKLDQKLQSRRLSHGRMQEEKKRLKEEQLNLTNAISAQKVIQEVAKSVQEHAHKRIARLVTKCLAIVFENPYTFEIDFVRKRNKTEAVLSFSRLGQQLEPLDSSGGGVVDIAALALRITCISLKLPKPRKLLVLDEPLKMVSRNYSGKVREMLEMLCEELGFQIIMATHNPSLRTGTVIEIE